MDRRRRPKRHSRVDIVKAKTTGARIRVRNSGLHAHAIPCLEMRHVLTGFDDDASRLMPEYHRRIHRKRPYPAVRVIMHVRPAYPDRVNLDADVVGSDFLRQVDIAQREFPDLL